MAVLIGPDVSFYQDDPQTPQGINFKKMRETAHCVIVRAGQNLWGDRDFKVNWREAKVAGLPRGSYWFYDSRIDPKIQAEKWVSMFENADFGELPLFGEFEDVYNGTHKGWRNWYNFLERVKELLPANKEIGIYTGYYYWKENTAGISTASLNASPCPGAKPSKATRSPSTPSTSSKANSNLAALFTPFVTRRI